MQTNSMRLLLNKKQAQVQALQEQQVILQNELQVATSKLDAAVEDGEGNSAASAARAYTHSLQQRVSTCVECELPHAEGLGKTGTRAKDGGERRVEPVCHAISCINSAVTVT